MGQNCSNVLRLHFRVSGQIVFDPTILGNTTFVVNGPDYRIDGVELQDHDLVVPHPLMRERAFVLAPLEELDPELVPPDWRATVPGAADLTTDVRRVGTIDFS